MEVEESLTKEERLGRQGWYLGEVTQDAAESLLTSSNLPNTFVVYNASDTGQYILSARFLIDGVEGGIIDHLVIRCTQDGKYCLTGQTDECDDVIEVVNRYTLTSEPPLVPALHGTSFETQVSITDAPPDYDKANRVLKPDIAPLPDIGNVRVDDVVEAKTGNISPSSSLRVGNNRRYGGRNRDGPIYLQRGMWVRYSEHNRCHPKNVCHGCCYRPVYWTGYSVEHRRKWYNPVGSGPLRFIGLLLFWLLCAPCFGCFKSCAFLCQLCLYICFYESS